MRNKTKQFFKKAWKWLVALVVGGVALANIGGIPPETPSVPDVTINGKTITLAYTDENVGEDLIIRSETSDYNGLSRAIVIFSVENKSGQEQDVSLQIYLANKKNRAVTDFKELEQNVSYFVVEYTRSEVASVGWDEFMGATYSFFPVISTQSVEKFKDIWSRKVAETKSLRPQKAKNVRGNVTKESFSSLIKSGETKYFQTTLTFEPGFRGNIIREEFFIEAIGDKGGYGLLDPWFNSDWGFRRKITIDFNKVGSISDTFHSNFPVLVSSALDDWKSVGNGGKVEQSNGQEFAFTSSDGITQLNHEIEGYEEEIGGLIAWINVTSVSATTDTDIFIYYGNASAADQENATATWNSNYKGVWHMDQDPSISTDGDCGGGTKEVCDSTSNNNDGDSNGTMTASDKVAGQVSASLDFDGGNDYIQLGDPASLNITGNITVSSWVNFSESQTNSPFMARWGSDQSYIYMVDFTGGNDNKLKFCIEVSEVNKCAGTTNTYNDGAWHYFVGRFDGSNVLTTIDGGEEQIVGDATLGPIDSPAQNIVIGAYNDPANFVNSKIDEFRISNTARSSDWIKTEYNNQFSPNTFYTIGAEELDVTRRKQIIEIPDMKFEKLATI